MLGPHQPVDDLGDERIDRARDDGDECLERGVLLDETREDLVDQRLGVDLLLNLVGDEDRQGVLDLLVVGEWLHRLEVALRVSDGAVAPIGHGAQGEQAEAENEGQDGGDGAGSDAALGGGRRGGSLGHARSLASCATPLAGFAPYPVVPRGIARDENSDDEHGDGRDA